MLFRVDVLFHMYIIQLRSVKSLRIALMASKLQTNMQYRGRSGAITMATAKRTNKVKRAEEEANRWRPEGACRRRGDNDKRKFVQVLAIWLEA